MRFLRKTKTKKSILVISDIHLGAGAFVAGQRNYLEDFHHDTELVDFLEYYSNGDFSGREVELVINGDLFDFLAVPFVSYYDDEFWSEEAALAKFEMILAAHEEVIEGFKNFVKAKRKTLVYIIGNHDAEMIFPKLRERFFQIFDEDVRDRVQLIANKAGEYTPHPGVVVQHGHDYEIAHQFSPDDSIVTTDQGKLYFIPPWGSYYVTRVINKFKEQRPYINAVRPIRKFMINGFIYDTLFTLRFGLANCFYFIMVRFISLFKTKEKLSHILEKSLSELTLFQDYESLTKETLEKRDDIKVLLVGHTHEPIYRPYTDGTTFINTGTWTRMVNLDFGHRSESSQLTYAQIFIRDNEDIEAVLNCWKGLRKEPFEEY